MLITCTGQLSLAFSTHVFKSSSTSPFPGSPFLYCSVMLAFPSVSVSSLNTCGQSASHVPQLMQSSRFMVIFIFFDTSVFALECGFLCV